MPAPRDIPTELRTAPFRGTVAVAQGLITSVQLRRNCWRRPFRDVYVWRDLLDAPELRFACAALLLTAGAAVSGRTAAWVLGADILRPNEIPEITLPRDTAMGPQGGVSIRRALLPDDDLVEVGGILVTAPLRTAFDLARRPDLVEGVVGIDALAHLGLIDLDDLVAYAAEHRGWRGVRQVARVADLSEPKTETPMETRLRLVLVLGGLPRPEPQLEVFSCAGLFVARLDLGYRKKRVGVEFDGQVHGDEEIRVRDLARRRDLRDEGWTLNSYTAREVYRQQALIRHQVRRLIAA